MKLNFAGGILSGTLVTAGILVTVYSLQDAGQVHVNDNQNAGSAISANQGGCDMQTSNSTPKNKNTVAPVIETLRQKSVVDNAEFSAACDDTCVSTLSLKIIGGTGLSSADWDNVRDASDIIAASLSKIPDAISSLRDRIGFSTEEGEIDQLMTIVSSLPDDLALTVIKDVSSYSDAHKTVALQTLSGLTLYSQSAAREIESLVIGEQDSEVITAVLNALESTDNHDFSPQTWQTLSSQLPYVEDVQLKSSILMSLAKHGTGDPVSLKNTVEEGLNSQSSDLQKASIEALGYLISRSENDDTFAALLRSGEFKTQLNTIAENPVADTGVRIDALTLLDEAF